MLIVILLLGGASGCKSAPKPNEHLYRLCSLNERIFGLDTKLFEVNENLLGSIRQALPQLSKEKRREIVKFLEKEESGHVDSVAEYNQLVLLHNEMVIRHGFNMEEKVSGIGPPLKLLTQWKYSR